MLSNWLRLIYRLCASIFILLFTINKLYICSAAINNLYLVVITMVNIFEFSDYKSFLIAKEQEVSNIHRGFRSRIAETLKCQNAYISQVLNTQSDFSLEQAFKIGRFLKLGEIETRYFLLLVELARAGTEELREYFKKDISILRSKHYNLNLENQSNRAKELSLEQQQIFYSSWLFPFIQLLISLPKYNSKNKVIEVLKLDEKIVSEVILFLISTGLVNENNGELSTGLTQIHLSRDSSLINQHHTNWRISAINSLVEKSNDDIHYSTISSLSYKDAEKLKVKFLSLIEDYTKAIIVSKEETIYNFNLDFYSMLKIK